MNILVTGGCGFIGSNFLNKYVLEHPEHKFVNLDLMTYAASADNISLPVQSSNNYVFIEGDIADKVLVSELFVDYNTDNVIHFAAETHVDMSLENPKLFTEVNVLGTQNLLDTCRSAKDFSRFHYISTDEVYGDLSVDDEPFVESDLLNPRNPYSASKAAGELLTNSYGHNFGLDVTITRCSNNYGPNQDKTKLIPKAILNILNNKSVPVYGEGGNVRDWIHVQDHVDAVWEVFSRGQSGEVYNIGTSNELENIELVKMIIKKLGHSEYMIKHVEDRLGHDRRYAIDSSKIKKELGWTSKISFKEGLEQTIQYYKSKSEYEKI